MSVILFAVRYVRVNSSFHLMANVVFVGQHLQELEQDLLQEETQLPVFFTHETAELMSVYDDISKSVSANNAGSAAEGR